jgi:acylphosphatase
MKACYIYITGKVQGVFFRKYTQLKAQKIGVKGWVKNTSDGRVMVYAIANENTLHDLITWCQKGSPMSVVKNVEVVWLDDLEAITGFEIMR